MTTGKTDFTKPTCAKLFHREEVVGTITNIEVMDMFNWTGDIELTPAAAAFSEMFAYYDDEKARDPESPNDDELPFPEELLDHWFIEDENGKRSISWPVIRNGNEVYWRD